MEFCRVAKRLHFLECEPWQVRKDGDSRTSSALTQVHEVITRFPAEELLVAGQRYYTVNGPLPTRRETETSPSLHVREMVEAGAKSEGSAS
jgi:hypothetical protein